MIHIDPFDEESATSTLMDAYLEHNGYTNDFGKNRLHHEIYLTDARKITHDKWKTIIRHPIKQK